MKTWQIAILVVVVIGALIGLSYALGWIGVHQTETIGKAQKDAERKVFEETQSYVEGKRQEATKYRLEYMRGDSLDKVAIKMTVAQSFANFDEDKLSPELSKNS